MGNNCMGKQGRLSAMILLTALLLLLVPAGWAQDRLSISMTDEVGKSGEIEYLEVYLANPTDEIFAFTLHLVLNRNDIAVFHGPLEMVADTTYWTCNEYGPYGCLDSTELFDPPFGLWEFMHVFTGEVVVGEIDTAGSLISGWGQVRARAVSTGGLGLDMRIDAVSDLGTAPPEIPPLAPQEGGLLFRIPFDLLSVPEWQEDLTASVDVDTQWKPYFVFSTPMGEAIGWITEQIPDTSYYMCVLPLPLDECGEWAKVPVWECPGGECDSMGIVMVDVAVLDDAQVNLSPGTVTIRNWVCGDVTGNDRCTIGDLTLLIDHLFVNNPAIDVPKAGDVNCSGEDPVVLTIGDVTTLIDHVFISQKPLCCEI